MKDIWKIENHSEMVDALLDILNQKSHGADCLENLNEVERVFYLANWIEMEINSGGFHSLLTGYLGELYEEYQPVYEAIGAKNLARICRDAVTLMKNLIPDQDFDFDKAMELMIDEDDCYEMFDDLDDQVYDYPDDTMELLYKYAVRNKVAFSYQFFLIMVLFLQQKIFFCKVAATIEKYKKKLENILKKVVDLPLQR